MALEQHNNLPLTVSTDHNRYLGISVRPNSFGFIVIEGGSVLDCGVRACHHSQFDDCLGQRFQRILRTYNPFAVIVATAGSKTTDKKRTAIARAIKKEAGRRDSPVIRIGTRTLHHYFGEYDASTRYEIARAVTTILPDLAWRLPPRAEPWQTDAYRMSIFDAAAVVIAHAML